MSQAKFHLPPELEAFVSDADSLLKQFQSMEPSGEDFLTITLYPDNSVALTEEELHSLLRRVDERMTSLSHDYIWYAEAPKLTVKKVTTNPRATPTTCFWSKIVIGDSIEDEWFAAYLALRISKEFPNISIKLNDSDGEYLLIEAADFIPDWLDPGNSENRVFIRGGLVHIVPIDTGRRDSEGRLRLEDALDAVQSQPLRTAASKQVQRAIAARTTEVYPAKASALVHTVNCLLPSTVARLFRRHPAFISRAVTEFSVQEDEYVPGAGSSLEKKALKRTILPAMQRFGADLRDYSILSIRISRLQYAKLTFQNFHPPRKFHEMAQKIAEQGDKQLIKSFDLGCRLTCGLELVYQRSKLRPAKRTDTDADADAAEPQSSLYEIIDETLKQETTSSSSSSSPATPPAVPLSIHIGKEDAVDSILTAFRQCETARASDKDDWLYLSPEELDAEMELRTKLFQAQHSQQSAPPTSAPIAGSSKDNNSDGSNDKAKTSQVPNKGSGTQSDGSGDVHNLDQVLKGFKHFMDSASGIDGINNIKSSADSAVSSTGRDKSSDKPTRAAGASVRTAPAPTSTSAKSAATVTVIDETPPLEVDFDEVLRILQETSISSGGGDGGGLAPTAAAPVGSTSASEPDDSQQRASMGAEGDDADHKRGGLEQYFYQEDLEDEDESESDEEDESDGDDDNYDDDASEDAGDGDRAPHAYTTTAAMAPAPSHLPSLAQSGVKSFLIQERNELGTGVGMGAGRRTNGDIQRGDDAIDSDDEDDDEGNNHAAATHDDNRANSSARRAGAAGAVGEEMGDESRDDEAADADDSEFLGAYETAMESELAASTLFESFVRYKPGRKGQAVGPIDDSGGGVTAADSDDEDVADDEDDDDDDDYEDDEDDDDDDDGVPDIDADLNLLKYILESHSAQLGSAGPATQLLSQLGIQLPHLPPMNKPT